MALHALFSDTLGGDARLLVDDGATGTAIKDALAALTRADPEDVVVIAFSGHGAPSHHLIAFDTNPADLAGTAISLEQLTELFAAIPARRLFFVLDCCFSGGMGAKVVRGNTTIDRTMKESVRAKLRLLVKRILKQCGYPPDKQEQATDTVLRRVELLSEEWALEALAVAAS